MAYRDAGDALETKLAGLLEEREDLDLSIANARRELEAHRAPARRARWKLRLRCGTPCLALLLVFMALVWITIAPSLERARLRDTEAGVSIIAAAGGLYLAEVSAGTCPDVDLLAKHGLLNASMRRTDAWNQPVLIECHGADVTVRSSGADGRHGTEDDIESP